MWFQPLTHWLLVAAVVSQSGGGPAFSPPTPSATPSAAAATAAPDMPEPIATRQAQFAIPFRVDRSTDPAWQPVEAQLLVSTDRGRQWRLYDKAPTTQQRFTFRAGGDGEYWFAIRTADRNGRVRPESITTPGLRVLVDTKPPGLKLTAQAVEDGQVMVHWKIDEPHVKPESLKIVYRPSPTEPWTAVAVDQQVIDPAAASQTGEIIFRPKAGSGDVLIRAEVSDTAGNSATANARVKVTPVAGSANYGEAGGSVAIAINPAVGNRFTASSRPSTKVSTYPGLPPGERPRMVNARTFELEYDVDSVGPSGIGRAELWGTRDGGQTWHSFVTSNENSSMLRVTVDDEGLYGFHLVLTNGAGVAGKTPKSGDPPDIWIGVDLTKPTARIVSVEPGVDAEAGRLIISWQADDLMLAARPVSLLLSENRKGPWTPIASGMENTGRYAWSIDGRTPPKIYLRLEVRDEAGNMGVHETAEPVVIDQSHPTARIRDVRPVGQRTVRPEWRP